MRTSDQYDMNTELPYDEMTAAAFRVEIAKIAEKGQEQFGALMNAPRSLTRSEKHLQLTAMHTANFGWSLVALIGWVEKTYGPEAGWKATAMAQDVMTNGGNEFCEDISLPGPLPPPESDQASGATRPKPHEPLCVDKLGHPHDNECECWCHDDEGGADRG